MDGNPPGYKVLRKPFLHQKYLDSNQVVFLIEKTKGYMIVNLNKKVLQMLVMCEWASKRRPRKSREKNNSYLDIVKIALTML